jgi:hypothetical protein
LGRAKTSISLPHSEAITKLSACAAQIDGYSLPACRVAADRHICDC